MPPPTLPDGPGPVMRHRQHSRPCAGLQRQEGLTTGTADCPGDDSDHYLPNLKISRRCADIL